MLTKCTLLFLCAVLSSQGQEDDAQNYRFLDPQIGGTRGNPGMKIRISPRGLEYIRRKAGDLINEEIRDLNIPDAEKSWSRGKIKVKNVRITELRSPSYEISLNSWRPGGRIVGRTENIEVKGDWKGELDAILTTVSSSGSFSATGSTTISTSAAFGRTSNGQPLLYAISCNADIEDLELRIGGGTMATVLDLFSDQIADHLKPTVERQICKAAEKFIQSDVNAKLRTLPTSLTRSRMFLFNLSLTEDPEILEGSMVTWHKGEISYFRSEPGSTPGFYPHDLTAGSSNSKMLHFYVSDYVVNTFLSSAHRNQRMRYTLTERNTPSVIEDLRTTCPVPGVICLGTFLPELEEQYPNSTASMRFETTADPTVLFTPGKAILNAKGKMKIYLHPQATTEAVQVLSADVSANVDLNLTLSEDFRKVFGQAKVNNLFNQRRSLVISNMECSVRDFTEETFQGFVDLAAPILEGLANKFLRRGIRIPLTQGIRLQNVELGLLERTAQISADVIYDR